MYAHIYLLSLTEQFVACMFNICFVYLSECEGESGDDNNHHIENSWSINGKQDDYIIIKSANNIDKNETAAKNFSLKYLKASSNWLPVKGSEILSTAFGK